MRDPHFVWSLLFLPELAAEHARRLQFGRGVGHDQPIRRSDDRVAEQVAGFPGRALVLRHIAPRLLVTARWPLLADSSVRYAAAVLYALAHIAVRIFSPTPAAYA